MEIYAFQTFSQFLSQKYKMTYDIALIFIYHKEISSKILNTLYETSRQRGIHGQGEPRLRLTLQTLVKYRTIIS